jgi:acyl carrier protein
MSQTLESRVRNVIVETFRLPPEAAKADLRLSDPPAWNSLGHMELVAALEKEFQVRFPGYELPTLISLDAIVRELEKHLQK